MEPIEALEIIEKAAASAEADHAELRKRAEDVYEGVVDTIAKRDGCSARVANHRALQDPLGKRAYELACECQERQVAARDAVRATLGSVIG